MSEAARHGATVLLIDDQAIVAESVRQTLLGEPGIRFHYCADALAAVVAAREIAPTVILQDLVMPGLDGLELVRLLKADEATRDIPLVVLSTREEPAVKAEAFRLGANDYLVKLPSPVELIARIRYHSDACRNATQRRLAYEALVESQAQLRQRNDEIARQAAELAIRNRFIQKTFGRYLSDEVVASLLDSPEGLRLGGETRVVTIMMADLRGFTSICETLAAAEVVRALNAFLGAMTEVVTRYRGTIIEFIGDEVLAVFGAPIAGADDAARAVSCAIAMHQALDAVNRDNAAVDLPPLEMGIALHTGEAVVGNIGSSTRVKYGVVGSHVNLTARIEAISSGGQVLISDATRRAAGDQVVVGNRLVLRAKGFQQPITAWELIGVDGPEPMRLPTPDDDLHALAEPLPVNFSHVTDKQVDDKVESGRLLRVSRRRALLETPVPLSALADLRLRAIDTAGIEIPTDLWAKVVAATPHQATLRFPPPPKALADLFASRIAATPGTP